jgi:hypothetical protein
MKSTSKSSKSSTSSSSSIDAKARAVLAGKYGSGAARKKALGADYAKVQARVNELLKKSSSSKTSSTSATATTNAVNKVANKKVTSTAASKYATVASKGLNLDTVFAVYKKKKR